MTKKNARQKMRDLEDRYAASAHSPTNSGHDRSGHHAADLKKIRVVRPGMVKQGSARPGMVKQASARPGMAKQGSARPGIAKQASARPGMAKQASARPGMAKQTSARPGMAKQTSTPIMTKQASKTAVKANKATLKKDKSKKELKKEKSKKELKKEKSKKELKKEKSKKELKKEKSKKELSKQPSRGDLNRTPSGRQMARTPSRGNLERAPSRGDLKRQGSKQSFKKRPSMTRTASSRSQTELERYNGRRRWRKFKKMEEKPKRSLVVIWLVVLAELSFDLGTTIIAFRAMLNDDDCCGYELELGNLPLSVATPFIFLICLELLILLRAMVLTMWPSILDRKEKEQNDDGTTQNGGKLAFCNCFRWSVKTLLRGINVLVLLNPFFGCIIAWMLLYQSDKDESFLVLGLEGGSIILHFISVKLEGSVQNFRQFLFHCMPLVPFIASVSLVLIYLKQTGVCYVVERSVFLFQGCEICPNGFPPIDGNCILDNGTVVSIDAGGFLNLDDSVLNNPGDLTKSTANQGTFCGDDHEGWNTNFCFFNYDGDD
ncbi:unnamed protein product [Cylindrotheca closterium]|uniref:Uncharacterized protein n=1 Tax=Cylindrotheca closterium TaxID=2856 RepID=A0AAD2CS44_9STRA|nr:unnamed protein product [Cylindrotheca closterium]